MNAQRIAIAVLALLTALVHTRSGRCDILHDQSVRAQAEYDAAVDEVQKKAQELGTKLDPARKDIEQLLAIGAVRDRYLTALRAMTTSTNASYTSGQAWLANLCGGILPATGARGIADGDQPAADGGAPPPIPAPPAALSRDACIKALVDGANKIRTFENVALRNTDDLKGHPVPQALGGLRVELAQLIGEGGHLAEFPVLASFCQLSESTTSAGAGDRCSKQLDALAANWSAFASTRTANQDLVDAIATATTRKNKAEAAKGLALSNESRASTPTSALTLADRLHGARKVRCITAYCWGGDGTRYAVEPVIDLPVGMFWALGNGSLANYVNTNRLDISVAAGLRIWFADDQLSFGVLLARPSLSKSGPLRLEYSDKPFPIESVGRPFPTLMVGAFGDSMIMTFSYDQVRNTDGSNPVDPKFLPGEVLSRAIVVGLALTPFTTVRNAIGASMAKPEQEEK